MTTKEKLHSSVEEYLLDRQADLPSIKMYIEKSIGKELFEKTFPTYLDNKNKYMVVEPDAVADMLDQLSVKQKAEVWMGVVSHAQRNKYNVSIDAVHIEERYKYGDLKFEYTGIENKAFGKWVKPYEEQIATMQKYREALMDARVDNFNREANEQLFAALGKKMKFTQEFLDGFDLQEKMADRGDKRGMLDFFKSREEAKAKDLGVAEKAIEGKTSLTRVFSSVLDKAKEIKNSYSR